MDGPGLPSYSGRGTSQTGVGGAGMRKGEAGFSKMTLEGPKGRDLCPTVPFSSSNPAPSCSDHDRF